MSRRGDLEYNPGVGLRTLRKLLGRRQAPRAEMNRPGRAQDEVEHERDLLERVAAGIALNKTPGR
jgi:hypothetical protein